MGKEQFFKVLKRMLEFHTINLKMADDHKKNVVKLWGSVEDYTLSTYDDFYEFLQGDGR